MRETFHGIAPDVAIRITGGGKHSHGSVVRTFDREGTRMVEYRSQYNGGLRLVPLAQVHVVRRRRQAGPKQAF